MKRLILPSVFLALVAALFVARPVLACPFCNAVSMTFSEEMKTSDAAVVAELVFRPAESADPDLNADPVKSAFKIKQVLKGSELIKPGDKIEVLFFGQQPVGTNFLLYGIDPKALAWSTPTPLTDAGIEYVAQLPSVPEAGPDRLAFFQSYFENADPLLADDAYNEFAKVLYADVVAVKDRMDREKLVKWIQDPQVSATRRRLYLTMLGICGKPEDVPMIEQLLKTEDRQQLMALDATIGCYLNLKGADGLPLVVDMFLKNKKAEYTDTYSAIMALRIMGQETTIIPRDQLVGALRNILDRPELADLVIPDLARWEDWSAMDKLVELFKNANEESAWVRVPVVNYLRACPEPKAKEYLEELAKIDPESVKRASYFFPRAGAPRPGAADASAAGAAPAAAPAATKQP